MSLRIFLLSVLLGSFTSTALFAEEDDKQTEELVAEGPKPPTHIPPPPPNLKPPSEAPTAPPPPRQQNKASLPVEQEQANEGETEPAPNARKMNLEQLLSLPAEQLMEIKDTIDKLVKLSPEEKTELRKRLDELKQLDEEEQKEQREAFQKRRRETNKQARILLWERMTEEEKAAAKEVIDAAENKGRATHEYVREALKDKEFRAEAVRRADEVLAEKAKTEVETE